MAKTGRFGGGALLLALIVIALFVGVSLMRDRDAPAQLSSLEPLPRPTAEQSFVETERGTKVWPTSAPLIEGVQYRYNTGHCGLDFMADFDGAFWEPHIPEGGQVMDFFINEDEGTLTVLSHDRALYRSTDGRSALLTRHDGPLILKSLCE